MSLAKRQCHERQRRTSLNKRRRATNIRLIPLGTPTLAIADKTRAGLEAADRECTDGEVPEPVEGVTNPMPWFDPKRDSAIVRFWAFLVDAFARVLVQRFKHPPRGYVAIALSVGIVLLIGSGTALGDRLLEWVRILRMF